MAKKKIILDFDVSYVGAKISKELDVWFHDYCKRNKKHKCDVIRKMIEDLKACEDEL